MTLSKMSEWVEKAKKLIAEHEVLCDDRHRCNPTKVKEMLCKIDWLLSQDSELRKEDDLVEFNDLMFKLVTRRSHYEVMEKLLPGGGYGGDQQAIKMYNPKPRVVIDVCTDKRKITSVQAVIKCGGGFSTDPNDRFCKNICNLDLRSTLQALSAFLPDNVQVYGNKVTFGVVALEAAYWAQGLKVPWDFLDVRYCRIPFKFYDFCRGNDD